MRARAPWEMKKVRQSAGPKEESVLPKFHLQSSATITVIRFFRNKDNYDIRKKIFAEHTQKLYFEFSCLLSPPQDIHQS